MKTSTSVVIEMNADESQRRGLGLKEEDCVLE